MADSIRKQIYDKVKSRLQTITTANGYESEIGLNVWESGKVFPKDAEGIILSDNGRSINYDTPAIGQQDNIMKISLTFVGIGGSSLQKVYKILADIEKAINTNTDSFRGDTWSSLAINTNLLEDEIQQDNNERKITGAQLTMEINYRTSRLNAYS